MLDMYVKKVLISPGFDLVYGISSMQSLISSYYPLFYALMYYVCCLFNCIILTVFLYNKLVTLF